MKLTKAQASIAKDNHRFRVVNCGRRFGKTTLAIEEIKGKALYKKSKIVYIAPTYQQARDIAWQTLTKELKPITKKINESRLELTVYCKTGGESLIQLRGWESIETLRGQDFDFIVIDEIASMRNFWMHWQEVIRPTLTDRKGHVLFISTPKGFNHFYDLYKEENEDKDYKTFNFSSYDNPHLPIDELEKAKQELTEDRFAQEYMADFRKTEGLVYKEFDRKRHLFTDKDEIPEFVKTIVGVDFGYTNPSTILQIKEDRDGNYWIISEWYKTKQTTEQIVQKAQGYQSNECYPDPAEPDRIEELKKGGLNVREVSKDIVAGINKVRELFKQNRIKINAGCKNLLWELETYHYPERGKDYTSKLDMNEKEIPVKENDHAVDALRYSLYSTEPMQKDFNFELPQTEW